jgi:hypothetical protein
MQYRLAMRSAMKTIKSDRAKPATPAKKRWHTPRVTFLKAAGALHDDPAPKENPAKRSPAKRTSRLP